MSEQPIKVALVTGGSRGIGKAIVQMLAREGYRVAFTFKSAQEQAQKIADTITSQGVQCQAYQVDVRDFEAVKKWVETVKEDFGRLDLLVNNAGVIADKALMMMTPDDWQVVLDTNLTGMFNSARACIITFMKQKKGQIINISSVSGVIGLPGQTNYSASKGGMNAFTRSLAKEVSGYGIRVNAVAPGFIETDILSGLSDDMREQIQKEVPLGKIGTVEDVAACVKFLAGEDASYLTGQVLVVDGGLAMP